MESLQERALFDPDLASVNPYDPMLNDQMKAKILKEAQINYEYFVKEIARVPAKEYFFELNNNIKPR